jgi:ABC-type phosphate transport system substrate-binding protein
MKSLKHLLLGVSLAWQGVSPDPGHRLAVIVNPESGVTSLTKDQIRNLYLGRAKYLRPGLVALPVEQVSPADVRERFYGNLVRLPVAQVRAYWARLYFSGLAQPPRQTDSDAETLQVVALNRGAIGFVDEAKVDARVRAVLILEGER